MGGTETTHKLPPHPLSYLPRYTECPWSERANASLYLSHHPSFNHTRNCLPISRVGTDRNTLSPPFETPRST